MTMQLPQLEGMNKLTNSSESCFKTCPKKFWYRYRLGLVPSHDADALRLGSAFHLGAEILKGGGDINAAVEAIACGYAVKSCPPWLTQDEYMVEMETAIALVRGWNARYGSDGICKYVGVEQSFDIPIVNPETGRPTQLYTSGGKIDGIVELPDARLAIMEHKTTSDDISAGSDYWKKLLFDAQISRYYLAARSLGYDISTVIYDVIRKPGIRPLSIPLLDSDGVKIVLDAAGNRVKTANGNKWRESADKEQGFVLQTRPETPVEYGARLLADLLARPDFYFARNEITRLEADLEEFKHDQWSVMKQIQESDKHGRWYRNTSACSMFGRCTYFDVCAGTAGDPTENIPAGFMISDVLHPELASSITE